MTDTHSIASGRVSATVSARGAELVSFQDAAHDELLWQAGPEWPRHAPVLFPIVGRLAGDTLRHAGKSYRLTQHGFARDSLFHWVERSGTRATLALADSDATRAVYPFAFRLELTYATERDALSVTARVTNPGDVPLPFCIGAHPGFRWPLADGVAKPDHVIRFETRETGPALPIDGGLLGPAARLPFDGQTLRLNEALFASDALVMPTIASRSVRYAALGPDGAENRALTIAWRGYEDLGIWSKPGGAPFLCVEPWRGMASPVGWDGEFSDKPGVVRLQPGESGEFEWRVSAA